MNFVCTEVGGPLGYTVTPTRKEAVPSWLAIAFLAPGTVLGLKQTFGMYSLDEWMDA